eukprot:scaffold1206_cov388-Prasinococcus_capsulatus_cf.AAC.60
MADLQQGSEHAGELGDEHADELPAQTPAPSPDQFKEAVWSSVEEAKKDLKAWAEEHAFQLRVARCDKYCRGPEKGKIHLLILECHRAKQSGRQPKHPDQNKQRRTRTKDCQCLMHVRVELKRDGRKPAGAQEWYALAWDKCNWEHNHCLYEDDKMMFNTQLPDGAREYARRLLDSGMAKRIVFDFLKIKFPGNWHKRAMYNAFSKDEIPMKYSCAELVRLGQQHSTDPNPRKQWTFKFHQDCQGTLQRVFWMTPWHRKNMAWYGRVLLLDATHGTNCAGYKLVYLTLIDETFLTTTGGYALLLHETAEDWRWVLQQVKETTNVIPG